MTTRDEMMRAVKEGATWRTRLIYLSLGITGLFFPGWTTVTWTRGVVKGFSASVPMSMWPTMIEELCDGD
jgi:hypothetical protein